jgi:pimeloyl-ACP methyl ester carboxylesterase
VYADPSVCEPIVVPQLVLDDATIHYEVEGQGAPVLLIQGVGVVGAGWRPQVDGLCDRYSLCMFDNRGIGRSSARARPTSVEQMAVDALALLDQLGWERAHVVGHSMGGLIAQQLGLDAPTRVASLSLLCTPESGRAAARPSLGLAWTGVRMRIGTRPMRRRAFLEVVMPRSMIATADCEALASRLAPLFGRDLADNPPILMQQVRAMSSHQLGPRLAELASIPTLVLCADEDPIAPPSAVRATADRIGRVRYVELGDASHGVTISHAEQINAILDEHFRSATIS